MKNNSNPLKKRSFFSQCHLYAQTFGIDFAKLFQSLRGIPPFSRNLRLLKSQRKLLAEKYPLENFPFGTWYPCLSDRFDTAGEIPFHYFYQDWFVAKKIFHHHPQKHVDLGSRIDGFVTHLAAFREVEIIDIRPLALDIPAIKFLQMDLMVDDFPLVDYCDSVSSLHAIEHFGLGRYGDPVDYTGYKKGLANIYRMLRRGGKFYFSVPIGVQRIEYNAHRIFSISYLMELLQPTYQIDSFSYVDDQNRFFPELILSSENISTNCGCRYGCGIFELTKK